MSLVLVLSSLWSGFPCCGWVLCFKRKGGDPGTDQLFFEDPADWHRPENRNSFRYPQRLRRTSTAKCSLKVSSWPVPVHRDGQGTERERLFTSCWVLWLAPVGLRGGKKLEAYHQSRHNLLSLWPSAFWDFGSFYQRRCGVTSYVLSGQPCLRLCRCEDFGFVSRHRPAEHRIRDVSAAPTLRRLLSRPVVFFSERRCGVTVCLQLRRSYLVLS